ncbi:MAG: hypothetical protein HY955_09195 [Deltaproteobacteria bacterium]|nr:hypothetical protein [Deltaproteobacteria bacterium]
MSMPAVPIFVVEGLDDVYVYETIEDAQRSLEPWWVKQKEGAVYDAEGRLLRLETDNIRVTIHLEEMEPTHASKLENTLKSYLKAIGEPIGDDIICNLACLVEFCRKFIATPRNPKNIIFDALLKIFVKFRKQL